MRNAGKKFRKGDEDCEISDTNVRFNGRELFYSQPREQSKLSPVSIRREQFRRRNLSEKLCQREFYTQRAGWLLPRIRAALHAEQRLFI